MEMKMGGNTDMEKTKKTQHDKKNPFRILY